MYHLSHFKFAIFFKEVIHCISLAKMCQIHEEASSIIWELGFMGRPELTCE